MKNNNNTKTLSNGATVAMIGGRTVPRDIFKFSLGTKEISASELEAEFEKPVDCD